MSKHRPPKEIRRYIRMADAQGWRHEMTSNGHYIFYPPDKEIGCITVSPGQLGRKKMNIEADLRRAGMVFEGDAPRESHNPEKFYCRCSNKQEWDSEELRNACEAVCTVDSKPLFNEKQVEVLRERKQTVKPAASDVTVSQMTEEQRMRIGPIKERVILCLRSFAPQTLTHQEIAEMVGLTPSQVYDSLKAMLRNHHPELYRKNDGSYFWSAEEPHPFVPEPQPEPVPEPVAIDTPRPTPPTSKPSAKVERVPKTYRLPEDLAAWVEAEADSRMVSPSLLVARGLEMLRENLIPVEDII